MKLPEIVASIVKGIIDYTYKMKEVGGELIAGLWQGILDAGAWLGDKISGFFGGIVDGVKGFFKRAYSHRRKCLPE